MTTRPKVPIDDYAVIGLDAPGPARLRSGDRRYDLLVGLVQTLPHMHWQGGNGGSDGVIGP